MRDILFRGKREDNGKWAEGSLLIFLDGDCFICMETWHFGCSVLSTLVVVIGNIHDNSEVESAE